MSSIGYDVINLDTDESHGIYRSLDEARGCVRFDRLRAYQIWKGLRERDEQGVEFVDGLVRVEHCEPYEGDDDRARQGLGLLG